MNIHTTRYLLPLALGALLLVAGLAPASAQTPGAMDGAMLAGELPELVTLKESDVKDLIRVGKELQELGVTLDSAPGSAGLEDQLAGQSKAMAILKGANFTPERLQQVAYSVGLAMAALDKEFEEARGQIAEMQKMKDSMPPEQWAQMEQMMGPALRMMEQALNQPKGNIALVSKYESELRSLGE